MMNNARIYLLLDTSYDVDNDKAHYYAKVGSTKNIIQRLVFYATHSVTHTLVDLRGSTTKNLIKKEHNAQKKLIAKTGSNFEVDKNTGNITEWVEITKEEYIQLRQLGFKWLGL